VLRPSPRLPPAAPMASRRRTSHNVEQKLARQLVKRRPLLRRASASSIPVLPAETATPSLSSQSTTVLSASPSSSASGPPGVSLPPNGVAAVVGIVVMLSLAVLGMFCSLLGLSHLTGFCCRLWRMVVMVISKEEAGRTKCDVRQIPQARGPV
jgi:hypothetical protein